MVYRVGILDMHRVVQVVYRVGILDMHRVVQVVYRVGILTVGYAHNVQFVRTRALA